MTTQPETAVGNDTPVEPTDPTALFEQMAREEFDIKDEEEQPAEDGQEPIEGADDEPQIEEEADDLPPIEAPVSWDAEAKELFKSLPREAQEVVQKREVERERFVQQKSQEATRAKTEAQQAAIQQLAAVEQNYAQQFDQLAQAIAPQAPDPALLRVNPEQFYALEYEYRAKVAQQQQLQQQAQQFASQAQAREQQAEQARMAQEHQVIVENFPEYADPTSGPKLRAELSSVAKEMGYTDELIAQARANDILAMRKAAEWKAKADKYDGLQKSKMEKVRAAKAIPPVARPGVAQGGDQLRARNAQAALEVARSSKDRNVQGAAFFDYLKNTGQI